MSDVTHPSRTYRARNALTTLAAGAALLVATGSGVAAARPADPAVPDKGAPPAATTQDLGAYSRNASGPYNLPPGGYDVGIAGCPWGERVLGGGASNSAHGSVVMTDSWPIANSQWAVFMKNNDIVSSYTFTVYAICGR